MPLNVTFDCNGLAPIADSDNKCPVKLTSFTQSSPRRISMPPKDCSAVEVRRLRYSVGRARKPKVILAGINMTVPEGAM